MKKFICILISAIMVASVFTALPLSAAAATRRVSLKKSSATLKLTKKNGKTVRGTTTIKVSKLKGVSIKKVTYRSSDSKIAAVNKNGKVTARKKGTAKITVAVKFTYKKHTVRKNMTFKVTVKDARKQSSTIVFPEEPTEPVTEPFSDSNATPLNNPPEIDGTKTKAMTDSAFLSKLSKFSNKLYQMSAKDVEGNYVMSPVSVYLAFALLYSVGDDGVKEDIKSLTEMNDADLKRTGELYASLVNKYQTFGGKTVSRLDLTNSIWLDSREQFNEEPLEALAKDMYCQAFKTPFYDNNRGANDAIRKYVKYQTNGLIDKDFQLDAATLFALVNTLYFKDVWDLESEGLATKTDTFTTKNGAQSREFLIGKYIQGQVQETDCSYFFYATTSQGYKAKFILPKDGFTLEQAMSADNLQKINMTRDFKTWDSKGGEHLTRCIFPSFKIDSETPLKDILLANGELGNAFTNYYSPLTDKALCVSEIKHKVVVDVSKQGIEGAAVTVIASKANSAMPDHNVYYHDFKLNSEFGFIITDPSDVTLFQGKVTQ